jgi:flavin-dependent dehydrogenase
MTGTGDGGAGDAKDISQAQAEAFDVVVVGGGPAGATVAGRLRQRGRSVVVLERDRFPRFHIGESLLPASASVLKALGLEEELDARFVRKYGARFLDDEKGPGGADGSTARYQFEEAFPPATPYAWQVPRSEFDALLLDRARALGADVREGCRVTEVLLAQGHAVGVSYLDATGTSRRVDAKVVVDATGREGLLTRARARTRIPGLDKTAIFTHVEGGHRNEGRDAGQIELTILAGRDDAGAVPGWAWFIPFKDGRASVGFVLSSNVVGKRAAELPSLASDVGPARTAAPGGDRLEALFQAEVARSPWMSHLLRDTRRSGPVRAAADYSFRVDRLAGDGWVAIGDAAGFLDPLFSTGAHLAMGGGERAAAAIDAALASGDTSAKAFEGFERTMRTAADLFLGAVQSFYRGELRALLFAPDQRAILRKLITSMLAGDVFHDQDDPARWIGFFRERFPAATQ